MKKSGLIFLIAGVLVSSVGIVSLLKPGFFLTDDGNSMVIRFSAFYETLRAGEFPVRFLSRLNFGYGYPVADFLYPLFMYVGSPIKALGFSFVDTVKLIFGLSFITGSAFSFLWLRKLFDEKSALVGSIIYSLFPYHLYDLYKRGSVGEILSLGILPFVLWQIERRSVMWSSISLFLLIISHNTLAVLFFIFILLYGLLDIYVSKAKRALFNFYFKTVLMGLGFSSFFTLPAVFDLQYTIFSKTAVSDWSKYFINFELIGISTVVIFIGFVIFVLMKKIDLRKHKLTLLMFGIGIVSIFLSLSVSSPLWNFLPSSFIQFPFRFLSLTIICTAFLGSFLIFVLKDDKKIFAAILITALVFLSSRQFLSPSISQYYPDSFYSTNQDTTTVKNEYMPKWVKKAPIKMSSSKVVNLSGTEKVNIRQVKANKIEFDTFLSERRGFQINTIYFPGWNVYDNGSPVKVSYNNPKGVMNFFLGKGRHAVSARFEETGLRTFADMISIASFLIAFSLFKFKIIK